MITSVGKFSTQSGMLWVPLWGRSPNNPGWVPKQRIQYRDAMSTSVGTLSTQSRVGTRAENSVPGCYEYLCGDALHTIRDAMSTSVGTRSTQSGMLWVPLWGRSPNNPGWVPKQRIQFRDAMSTSVGTPHNLGCYEYLCGDVLYTIQGGYQSREFSSILAPSLCHPYPRCDPKSRQPWSVEETIPLFWPETSANCWVFLPSWRCWSPGAECALPHLLVGVRGLVLEVGTMSKPRNHCSLNTPSGDLMALSRGTAGSLNKNSRAHLNIRKDVLLKRRIIVRSREVLKTRDWYCKLSYRFEIWQAHRLQCCRSVCQISER